MGNNLMDARTYWLLFVAQPVNRCFFREIKAPAAHWFFLTYGWLSTRTKAMRAARPERLAQAWRVPR